MNYLDVFKHGLVDSPIHKTIVNEKSSYEFYNPFVDKYTGFRELKRCLSSVGLEISDWYNYFILGIEDRNDSPICPICKSRIKKFCDIHKGYYKTCCSNECIGLSLSKSNIERYKDPKEREKTSIATSKGCMDPEIRKKKSEVLKEYNRLHPENGRNISNSLYNFWGNADDNRRKEHGNSIKKAYKENPELRENRSRNQSERWENPTERMIESLSMNSLGIHTHRYSYWEEKYIHLDSLIERAFFEYSCKSLKTFSLVREPVSIRYFNTGKSKYKTYRPDFLYNNHYLVEVKPSSQVNSQEVIDKMNAAIDFCYLLGLEYVILTEKYLYEGADPYYGNFPDLKLAEDDRNKISDILNQIREEHRESKRRKKDEGLSDCS